MDFDDADDIAYFTRQAVFWPTVTKAKYPNDHHHIEYAQTMVRNFIISYYESITVPDGWDALYRLIPNRFTEAAADPFPTPLLVYVMHNFTSEQIRNIVLNTDDE